METPEDTIYLLFKNWYIQTIDRQFLHEITYRHYTFIHKISTYIIIVLSGINAFIAGSTLIFTELSIKEAVIAAAILLLVIDAIEIIVSGITSFRNFGELAESHKKARDEFMKLSENIIKVFTPLSENEAEVDLSQQRDYIQELMGLLIDISPNIPNKFIKDFNQAKEKSKKYQDKMNLFQTIEMETTILGENNNVPELARLYNEATNLV